MQHGVEYLDIKCCGELLLLSCKTLAVLKLEYLVVTVFSSVDLPSLKSLHLNYIKFEKELLCGCPILEYLEARQVLHFIPLRKGEFKTLSKLVRVDIAEACRLHPRAICNAEIMRLQYMGFQSEWKGIPTFPNLTRMELVFRSYWSWKFVLDMLKQCPKLQILVLDKLERQTISIEKVFPYPFFVPECLSSHLRKCAFIGYEGTENELLFAKYIMQNSTSLRAMTICFTRSSTPQEKLEMITNLTSSPKRSASCELSLK